jgi:hypothetical protein
MNLQSMGRVPGLRVLVLNVQKSGQLAVRGASLDPGFWGTGTG